MLTPRRGRPSKYAEFDALVASLPDVMEKRPKYVRGIGVFRGSRETTAWLKIRLPNGGTLRGKSYPPDASVEVKVGNLASWSWERLIDEHRELQGRADRGEPLEDTPDVTFGHAAEDWLTRAENRVRAHETARIHVRRHLVPAIGSIALRQLSSLDVNRWIARQLRSAAPGTVKRQFNTLRAILNDAVRSGLIEKSPCRNADPIRGAVARQGSSRSRNWLACSRSRKRKPDGSLISSCGRFTLGCARARFKRWYGPISASLVPIG
jgi:hypothetical protein